MFNIFVKVILLLLVALSLHAKGGLTQKHLLSLSTDKIIEVEFDLPIIKSSVRKNSIGLKSLDTGQEVKGVISFKTKNTLFFTPLNNLQKGEYKLRVKSLKLEGNSQDNYRGFKKYLYKLCSFFYDDVSKCPLYGYITSVKTKRIKHTFSIEDNKVQILNISLSKSLIELKEGNETIINVNANYDDNTTEDITQDVTWIVGNDSIISTDTNKIIALEEGETTLQALYEAKKSTEIKVRVYKEVNGYKLPLEPDETLNNSTLLGIDTNNNGVRDDVERWIFLEMKIYNGYEKIEQVIAMQKAKALQMTLEDPTNEDDKVEIMMNAAHDCWFWYSYSKSLPFQDNIMEFSRNIKDKCFNTKKRLKTYWQFDSTLAGRVFTSTPTLQTQSQCEVSIDGL